MQNGPAADASPSSTGQEWPAGFGMSSNPRATTGSIKPVIVCVFTRVATISNTRKTMHAAENADGVAMTTTMTGIPYNHRNIH